MPLVDTDADLSRIKALVASPALVESGLMSRTVMEQANAILGTLEPGERFAVMTSVTTKGLLVTTAIQSDDQRWRLAAYIKRDFTDAGDTEAGLTLRYSF